MFHKESNGSPRVCPPASLESWGLSLFPFSAHTLPTTIAQVAISSLHHVVLSRSSSQLSLPGATDRPKGFPAPPADSLTSWNPSRPPLCLTRVTQSAVTCHYLSTARGGGRGAAPWGRSAGPCCWHSSRPRPDRECAAGPRAAGGVLSVVLKPRLAGNWAQAVPAAFGFAVPDAAVVLGLKEQPARRNQLLAYPGLSRRRLSGCRSREYNWNGEGRSLRPGGGSAGSQKEWVSGGDVLLPVLLSQDVCVAKEGRLTGRWRSSEAPKLGQDPEVV